MNVLKKGKRLYSVICVLSALLLLTGCTGQAADGGNAAQQTPRGNMVIVTTIFPLYDWVNEILGPESDAGVVMLLDNGVDLHSFQPTAQDVMKIATCDLFLYVGGESDEWVEDALKEAVNPELKAVNLLEALGERARTEEHVEGMEEEEDHANDEDSAKEEDHDHGAEEYDEHIWLSLQNASYLCGVIADAIKQADPDNAPRYEENLSAYREALSALDGAYRETVEGAPVKTLLFGDRFPFRYLTDDYHLTYYAAFAGCSAETEASFETVTFLSNKVNELHLNHVMMIEGGDGKIAQTIVKNTEGKDQKILALDSMQNVTGQDVRDGTTYLSIMEENLEILKEALQ